MHPRQIEQIPLYKSPSLSFSAHLLACAVEESSLSSVPPPLLSSSFFSLAWLYSSSPLSFVLFSQRFERSPIVSSTFEICEETEGSLVREKLRARNIRALQLKAHAQSKVNLTDKFSILN